MKLLNCKIFLYSLVLFAYSLNAATITVNTVEYSDADDGFCSMLEAVDATNTNIASGMTTGECAAGEAMPVIDIIEFDASILPAYIVPVAPFELNESVHIKGTDRELVYFTGAIIGRAFTIQNLLIADGQFKISDVTFLDNHLQSFTGDYGGAIIAALSNQNQLVLKRVNFISNSAPKAGGALSLFGTNGNNGNFTNIIDCYFEGNFAQNYDTTVVGGGAIFIGAGYNVLIENSTFSNNFTFNLPLAQPQSDADGGAILMRSSNAPLNSTVTIENSTFSGNHATGVGGALALGGPGFPVEKTSLTIKHSTIIQNTADSNDDLLPISGGGGIWSASSNSINLKNTILALNVDNSNMPKNDFHGSVTSFGHNFIGDNSGNPTMFPAGQPNVNDEWVGVPFVNLDPELSPLAENGNRIPTHLPIQNSLVIDQGKCSFQLTDQRYYFNSNTGTRAFDVAGVTNIGSGDGCDVGAVEYNSETSNPIPVAINDSYTILEGETLIVDEASGLLSNDSDDNNLVVLSVGTHTLTAGTVTGELDVELDGSLQFLLDNSDDYGQFNFQYEISDKNNKAQADLIIDVLPVNDEPSFTPEFLNLDVTAGQNYVFPQWATDIIAGPANESSQNLMFSITPAAPIGSENYFSIDPFVDHNGTLSFQIHTNATGTGQIAVALVDDGGTANGGDNWFVMVIDLIVIEDLDLIFENGFE